MNNKQKAMLIVVDMYLNYYIPGHKVFIADANSNARIDDLQLRELNRRYKQITNGNVKEYEWFLDYEYDITTQDIIEWLNV